MARHRQARLTADEISQLPQLNDESPNLWKNERSAIARDLLSAAVRCFAANGYHGTTTRDVSQLVGLSPAALYVHFPSKESILFEIIRMSHENVLAYVTARDVMSAPTADARLVAFISRYAEWHARHCVAARVSQFDMAALEDSHYATILDMRRTTTTALRTVLDQGVAEDAFTDVDIPRVSRAMLSLGTDLVRWYRPDGADSPEQVGAFTAKLALGMVT